MLLLSPYLKNPNQPAIQDAAVWIQGDTIQFAGKQSDLPKTAKREKEQYEIRNAILFPGLVNAHCHLELTTLENLNYPGNFVDWIRKVLAKKLKLSPEEQSKSITKGILLSILGGTTTIGDHMSVQGDVETLLNSPLRGKIFLEILGVVPEVAQELFKAAQACCDSFQQNSSRFEIIPSPHSIHALDEKILKQCLELEKKVFSIHLAESEVEQKYFETNSGALFDFIAERGNELKRKYLSGLDELFERNLLTERVLVIHGNYLTEENLRLLAERNISVVYCPLSHQYFKHQSFPLKKALNLNLNLALGTDSLSSSTSLSMLEVMRQTKVNFPQLSEEAIFSMATLGGAKALKMEAEVGRLESGKKADVAGVKIKPKKSPLASIFAAEQVEFLIASGKILMG